MYLHCDGSISCWELCLAIAEQSARDAVAQLVPVPYKSSQRQPASEKACLVG